MKTIAEYERVKIPNWALSYLVNGDGSGLEDKEIRQIDRWINQYYNEAKEQGGTVILGPSEEYTEPYFSNDPEFGLPCDVEDYNILIVK